MCGCENQGLCIVMSFKFHLFNKRRQLVFLRVFYGDTVLVVFHYVSMCVFRRIEKSDVL